MTIAASILFALLALLVASYRQARINSVLGRRRFLLHEIVFGVHLYVATDLHATPSGPHFGLHIVGRPESPSKPSQSRATYCASVSAGTPEKPIPGVYGALVTKWYIHRTGNKLSTTWWSDHVAYYLSNRDAEAVAEQYVYQGVLGIHAI